MLQTEFVKNLHSNYERILLEEMPQERRYQYCMLSRGGIKGLLPCSLRYLNGRAYLYYDITSLQNVQQCFQKRKISREWMKDFVWSFKQIRQELERFLLNAGNILWYPGQIYQDLEDNVFSFFYVPYYEGDNGFRDFLEFLIEYMDYEDEVLVECVYKMYEQYERNGDTYLQHHFFEDARMLEKEETGICGQEGQKKATAPCTEDVKEDIYEQLGREAEDNDVGERKGFLAFFENRRHKNRKRKADYRQELQISMEGFAVAEELDYESRENEDFGKTVYIEEPQEKKKVVRRLYSSEGRVLAKLEDVLTIGKKKEEVDLVLEDASISRMHARITREGEDYFLEDINSTNGTFKNGLRLQPYEKKRLQEEDEIMLGKVGLTFR